MKFCVKLILDTYIYMYTVTFYFCDTINKQSPFHGYPIYTGSWTKLYLVLFYTGNVPGFTSDCGFWFSVHVTLKTPFSLTSATIIPIID